MNRTRRKKTREIINALNSLAGDIESLLDEEQDYLDNMPENLQSGERYETAERAVESFESAKDSMEDTIKYLDEAMS